MVGHFTTLPALDTPKLQHCPAAYGFAVLVVMAAAVGASFAPSRQAVRVDAMTALRCD
jgi:hypothetical protein